MRFEGGTVVTKNLPGLISYLHSFSYDDARNLRETVHKSESEANCTKPGDRGARIGKQTAAAYQNFMVAHSYGFVRNGVLITREMSEKQAKEDTIRQIESLFRYASDYAQNIKALVWSDQYAIVYIGNPDKPVLIPEPEQFLEYIPEESHEDVSPAAYRAMVGVAGGGPGIVPADMSAMTVRGARDILRAHQDEINALDEHYKQAQRGESEELVELKRELDRIQKELDQKKRALLEQLEEKKAEMLVQKAQMESQIFMLDSEIYNIECYMGEVVKFAKIRSGKNAPNSEPIIIHQKLRFLDEDLGRLASIYEIEWNQVGMFEEFLRHSPLALDTFAPNERCVMLVRLSRNAVRYANSNDMPFKNMLDQYEVFHGRTVGIIVRNGENVYLGWTDEDRVHIADDLVFSASQIHTEIVPDNTPEFRFKSDRDKWLADQIQSRKNIIDGLVSRSFIFSVLQGLVDRTNILPLPHGTKINKGSKYIIFSVADAWLSDNKYGSFMDLIKRCNERVTKGDMILTMQYLRPQTYSIHGYAPRNDRGRGYNDRTHDVFADDCTLYPINLVELDDPVEMIRYKYPHPIKMSNTETEWMYGVVSADREKSLSSECVVLERFIKQDRHVFISLLKTDSDWRRPYWADTPEREPRANFELYSNEYVNLTYMNSQWLEWVATTKNLGGMIVGGQKVDYAHMIRYVKTALDFVRKREQAERAEIESASPGFCDTHKDWPVLVSEFKLQKNVREITPYQAKRFVKWANIAAAKEEFLCCIRPTDVESK